MDRPEHLGQAVVPWSAVMEQHDLIVICGQGPSWRYVELDDLVRARRAGAAIIAVNGAIDCYESTPFTHWFTLDFSAANRRRMANPREGVTYYAAAPDDYGHEVYERVTYLHRLANDAPADGPFRVRAVCQIVGGLSEDPGAIHTGNSGFGAFGLAYHMHPRRVVLLGIDGQGKHRWDGTRNYWLGHMHRLFHGAIPQLCANNIQVVNGSPETAVYCLPVAMPKTAVEWLIS